MFSKGMQVWRQHPALRQSENVKKMLPGFGTAVAIFSAYVFGEAVYNELSTNRTHATQDSAASAAAPSH